MSTIRANSITNSAGTGAPDFPNGITVAGGTTLLAIATQAQAETGTDNSTLMTPLRAAQAIGALVPPAASYTLLGTLSTTSGTSQTLSGLTLTGYKFLHFSVDAVLTVGTGSLLAFANVSGQHITLTNSGSSWYGGVFVDLSTGLFFASIGMALSGVINQGLVGVAPITNASTSITVSSFGRNYGGGAIRIYGVK